MSMSWVDGEKAPGVGLEPKALNTQRPDALDYPYNRLANRQKTTRAKQTTQVRHTD